MVTAGAPDPDRPLVVDQPPAAPRQDRRTPPQARALLLAVARRESPDEATVWCDAATDLGAARAGRLIGVRGRRPWAKRGRKAGEVSVNILNCVGRAAQFGPPSGLFEARSMRGGILTRVLAGRCRMRPIVRSGSRNGRGTIEGETTMKRLAALPRGTRSRRRVRERPSA